MNGRRKVWLFFLLAFGWSWLFWVPTALASHRAVLPAGIVQFLNSPLNPAPWGPLIAALIATALEEGRAGIKHLLRRGVAVRFDAGWYAVIFLLFPALVGGALGLAVLSGEPAPAMPNLAKPVTIPFAFLYILLLGGPLQEEFGWRGYALTRLQERWNALVSSIMIGLAWGFWHLPLFFIFRQEMYYQRPFWGLLLSTTLVSILFTWLYNNTHGSVFAALLFHTMFNLSHYLFPTLASDRGNLYLFGLLFLTVIVVVVGWGPQRLTREAAVQAAS